MNYAKRLVRWLTLADYYDSKSSGSRRVVQRFARGNVAIQRGSYLTSDELSNRAKVVEKSMAAINKAYERSRGRKRP